MNNLTWHHCSFGSNPFRARNGLVEAAVFQEATLGYRANLYHFEPDKQVTDSYNLVHFIEGGRFNTRIEAMAYAEEQLNAY